LTFMVVPTCASDLGPGEFKTLLTFLVAVLAFWMAVLAGGIASVAGGVPRELAGRELAVPGSDPWPTERRIASILRRQRSARWTAASAVSSGTKTANSSPP